MVLPGTLEDLNVRRLGDVDEADLELAFEQVDAALRRRFVKGARDRFPGLPSEDLADAWQDTLKALLEALRGGRLDAQRNLVPWLWTIYVRRLVDDLRRRRTRLLAAARITSPELPGAPDGADDEERRRLLERVRAAAEGLPPRQRTVLRVFLDEYPATEDRRVLRDRVSAVSGRAETPGSVRRALEEARRKLGEAFRKGLL